MGFRFRKSIKIAPGVRLNLSKKSASVSFGKRGLRHSISTSGRRTTSIGIPGTGIYYTKSSKIGNMLGNKSPVSGDYTDPYQEVVEFEEALEYIRSFHKECDYAYDWESVAKEPPPFNQGEKGPNEILALEKLESFRPNILGRLFKFLDAKQRDELEKEVQKAQEEDKKLYQAWEKRKKISQSILDKDIEAYMAVLQDIKSCNELTDFINSFKFQATDPYSMIIDCDINLEDIIPTHYKTLTKTGRLSVKKYNKTDYYAISKSYVSSLILRIARNIFGLLPLKSVIINTQTRVIDTSLGKSMNITILSIRIDKNTLDKLNFDLIDPFDALTNFEHNVRFLKTKGFQGVEKLSN